MGFALALLGFVVRFHDNIGFGARTAAVLIEAIFEHHLALVL